MPASARRSWSRWLSSCQASSVTKSSTVKAIGAGADLDEIRTALAATARRRDALQAELPRVAEETEPPAIDRRELRARLQQWRESLRAAPEVARKILRLLLPEPLVVDRTAQGVRYRGSAAFAALFAGILPDCNVSALVLPGGAARTHTIAFEEVIAA